MKFPKTKAETESARAEFRQGGRWLFVNVELRNLVATAYCEYWLINHSHLPLKCAQYNRLGSSFTGHTTTLLTGSFLPLTSRPRAGHV